MQYRIFGKLGWRVSEIGFGAWAIGGDMWGAQDDCESVRALQRALDLGVNFIDTAQGYGKGHSEELIGQVLRERKEEIYVATKIPPVPGTQWPPPDNQKATQSFPGKYIIEQCEGSLKRLRRDYIDVYQFHTWATAFNAEDEWFEAICRLKQEGKIRASGVSVPDTAPDDVIGSLAKGRIDAVQVIYNIFEQYPNWNLFPVSARLETALIIRVPFDEGALTGKFKNDTVFPAGDIRQCYFRGKNLPAVIKRVEKIKNYKNIKYPEMSMPEFALRFCLSNPAVTTVIPGIRSVQQSELNSAVSDGKLLPEEIIKDMEQFQWRKDFWHEEVDL